MKIIQCAGDLSDWGGLMVSEVVIKVEFGVVEWLLPLACGKNPVCDGQMDPETGRPTKQRKIFCARD